jgi:hypothetical protein
MWTESLMAGIERARSLDTVGRKLGLAVANVVRPGRAADALVGVGVLAAVPTAATGLSDLADVVDPRERSLGTAHAPGTSPPSPCTAAPTWRGGVDAVTRECGWPCWAPPW